MNHHTETDPDLIRLLNACHRDEEDITALLVAADRAQELGRTKTEWFCRWLGDRGRYIKRVATGSRAYGKPTTFSDWDWVVMLDSVIFAYPKTGEIQSGSMAINEVYDNADLWTATGESYEGSGRDGLIYGSARFDAIDVIIVRNQAAFDAWKEATAFLKAQAERVGPCPRDFAIRYIQEYAKKHGVE